MSSQQADVIVKFKVQDPEPDMYPLACVREQGRPVILVRAKNALMINSSQAKRAAATAQVHVPGHQNNGLEPMGGAYCVEAESGEFLASPPMIKEGEALPDNIRYERKFRLNPSL